MNGITRKQYRVGAVGCLAAEAAAKQFTQQTAHERGDVTAPLIPSADHSRNILNISNIKEVRLHPFGKAKGLSAHPADLSSIK